MDHVGAMAAAAGVPGMTPDRAQVLVTLVVAGEYIKDRWAHLCNELRPYYTDLYL